MFAAYANKDWKLKDNGTAQWLENRHMAVCPSATGRKKFHAFTKCKARKFNDIGEAVAWCNENELMPR